MRAVRLLAVGTLLLTSLLIPFVAGAQTDGSTIYLRRASFDPLQEQPAELATVDQSETTLLLAQLDGEPTSTRVAALRSAGLEPLIYIPDNAFLVRTTADSAPQAAGLRWYGSLPPAYKLSAELAAGTDTSMLNLRVTAAPDVDLPALTAAISAVGGTLDSSYIGLTGTSLAVHLPQSALASFTARDDVIWVEQREIPQLLNNTSRALIGVDTALQELTWLTGAGQIVAVTDSGLDVSDDVSDDFSGRVVATFTPKQMYSGCTTTTWSDYYGHGTHVSGSILGSSALSSSGTSFAGVAPGALLVVETATSSNSGGSLDCLSDDDSFLEKAYNAGARIQNASWGSPTGSSPSGYTYGGYDTFAVLVDDFLYNNPEHLLVVAAGNAGVDADRDGVIDADSIGSPATAKNVLAVGASENNRQPTSTTCSVSSPLTRCWSSYVYSRSPISSDFVSDNPSGMAAFSSRGPTDDGRIKPDLVAPGTNVVSSRSHMSSANYTDIYDSNYAYESGTSMATPMVSGSAALVRQWLSKVRGLATPSAALVKALLLNGAEDLSPGQYGTGSTREIPAAWPNSVQGWGRANVADSVQLSDSKITLTDNTVGLSTSSVAAQSITVVSGTPHLRVTLTWTDYPGTPLASKALVNDLDLEVVAPDGSVILGNASADLSTSCRSSGADRCNTSESIDIAAADVGSYTMRVNGTSVAYGPQPFALVIRAEGGTVTMPSTEELDEHLYLPFVGNAS